MNMRWNQRYLLRSYIRASLWIVPFAAVALYWVVSRGTHGIEHRDLRRVVAGNHAGIPQGDVPGREAGPDRHPVIATPATPSSLP
jgi:hypothetical protein